MTHLGWKCTTLIAPTKAATKQWVICQPETNNPTVRPSAVQARRRSSSLASLRIQFPAAMEDNKANR